MQEYNLFQIVLMLEYDKVEDGYKMIGNAVPPYLAYKIASQIKQDLNY